MMPWPVALFVAIVLLSFSIPMLAFAIGIWVRLSIELYQDISHGAWASLPVTLLTCVVMGGFSYLFGVGAYKVGSNVIDGLIYRFL